MFKKTGWGFTITALIIAGAIYSLATIEPQLGIDLRGGTELTYRLDLSRLPYDPGTASVADTVKDMISTRLDAYGLKEISISTQGSDRIVVQLPGAADSQTVAEYKRQIEEAGQLDFLLEAEDNDPRARDLKQAVDEYNAAVLSYDSQVRADPKLRTTLARPVKPALMLELEEEHRQYLEKMKEWNRLKDEQPELAEPTPPEWIVLPTAESTPVEGGGGARRFQEKPGGLRILHFGEGFKVSGSLLTIARPDHDEKGRPSIAFGFGPVGAARFGKLTGPNKGRTLCIALDGRVIQAAEILSKISESGRITGRFTSSEVLGVVNILRGGSLPAEPELISESTIGALLGQESIRWGTFAVLASLIIILVFMAMYYTIGGLVADLALVLNILLILGYVWVFRQTLTFPGIAGVLLTIGMAVDANILIFERVREELRRGKSLVASLTTGYQRAFWVIFDSNLTTLITGIVLFQFGTGPVKGFAVTLVAGILASFFTAVYVTRMILSFLYGEKILEPTIHMLVVLAGTLGLSLLLYLCHVAFGADVLRHALLVAMIAGVLAGFFAAVHTLRLVMRFLTRVNMLKNSLPMLQVIGVPRVDFQGYKRPFLWISVFTILLTWGIFVIPRGSENYGIDFTGGSRITMNLADEISRDRLVRWIEELPLDQKAFFSSYSVQTVESITPGRSRTFTLLTRARPRAGKPPVAAPAEGEAPGEKKAAEGGAETAAGGEGGTDQQAAEDHEMVRRVLERILGEQNLLLPDPFPGAEWVPASPTPGGAPQPGELGLVLQANVLRFAPPEPEPGAGKDRKAILQELLNDHLEETFKGQIQTEAAGPGAFKGIQAVEVQEQPGPAVAGAPITRYVIKTTGYRPPEATIADAGIPSRLDVEAAVKDFFRGKFAPGLKARFPRPEQVIQVSEPFPEVLAVGPRVATNLQRQALIALFICMVAMVFYLSLRFEFSYGVAAVVALLHDVLVSVGIMAMTDVIFGDLISLKINLTEVAAILTIVGYSVNDTIVVFDRVRENLRAGMKRIEFEDLVNASINQTLARTIWTASTTLVVILALLGFGGEPVKGFAFAFAVGMVSGTYSSVFVASPVLIFLRRKAAERRERLKLEAQMA